MMIFVLAALAANPAPSADTALTRCRPLLTRKAGGEIATIAVNSSHRRGGQRIVSGRLTSFVGMGPPAPGSASAHHLIRAEFIFTCRIGPKGHRSASVSPLR